LGISWLWVTGNRPHFRKPKPKGRPYRAGNPIFIKPSRKTDWIGKGYPPQFLNQGWILKPQLTMDLAQNPGSPWAIAFAFELCTGCNELAMNLFRIGFQPLKHQWAQG
jgi:hypothetical protein